MHLALNDDAMGGPTRREEWDGAMRLLHAYLGIGRNRLEPFIYNVFIDVRDLAYFLMWSLGYSFPFWRGNQAFLLSWEGFFYITLKKKLDWLADNPFYTKRVAFYVGRRCRRFRDHGCRQRTAPGLEDGQVPREAIHARAVEASWNSLAEGDRHRRYSLSARATLTGSWSATSLRQRPIWFGGEDQI